MRNECNIILDILPLYVENMVTSDTADFVEEHLKSCEACRKEYERTREEIRPEQKISDAAPLLKLRQKLKIMRIQTIALTAVFVTVLLVSAFAVLDAPVYFPYSEGLVTTGALDDRGMLLTFDEKVTDFSYTIYEDPDKGDFYYCEIEAWTSLWDQWFSKKGSVPAAVITGYAKPMLAVYVPNDGTKNVCIAKYDPDGNQMERHVDDEEQMTLPRLSLGYYFVLAAAALAVMGIMWYLIRKKEQLRVWVERIGLYPAAYMISHCIVSGISRASYSLPRDLALIIFISVLMYSGFLLAHNVWRLKIQIKEISR